MGFPNACVCDRCLDRDMRSADLRREGRPNAASLARQQSADYFATPWKYRDPGDGRAPQPL